MKTKQKGKKVDDLDIDSLIGNLFFSHTGSQWDNPYSNEDRNTGFSEKAMNGMKKLFWYRWHIDDWASSTKVEMLTMEEEGIYRRLLDRAWSMPGTALPLDFNMLSRLTKNSPIEVVKKIIGTFFVITDQGYVNKRLLKERQESESLAEAITNRAKKGADKRWHGKSENNQDVNAQEHAQAMPKHMPKQCSSNAQEHAQAMLDECTATATDTDTKNLGSLEPLSGLPDEPPESQLVKIPYDEIIEYLNTRSGSKYTSAGKDTRRCIKARWNEKRTFADFKTVIDNMTAAWGTDEKMLNYLRPITLFGTKFESYLNWKNGGGNAGARPGAGTGTTQGNFGSYKTQGVGIGIKPKPGDFTKPPTFTNRKD